MRQAIEPSPRREIQIWVLKLSSQQPEVSAFPIPGMNEITKATKKLRLAGREAWKRRAKQTGKLITPCCSTVFDDAAGDAVTGSADASY